MVIESIFNVSKTDLIEKNVKNYTEIGIKSVSTEQRPLFHEII